MLFDITGVRLFAAPNERSVEHLGIDIVALPAQFRELAARDDQALLERVWADVAQIPGTQQEVSFRAASGTPVHATLVNAHTTARLHGVVVHLRRGYIAAALTEQPPAHHAVPSREAFMATVNAAITRTTQQPGYGFSVLIIDLDRIKVLLGGYGQTMVRKLLQIVSEQVDKQLGANDLQMPLGMGEIGVFLDGMNDREEVGRLAEDMLQQVTSSYRVHGKLIRVTGVVGVATSERQYRDAEQVIGDAALACGRARSRGRTRREVYRTQMRLEDTMKLSLAGELHQAVHEETLQLYYQPIVSLGSGRLRGFEALLRWPHALRGMVPPEQFIPIAEESALIIPMGAWVLKEACRSLAVWRQKALGADLFVSVNLSAKQFASRELIRQIQTALDESGLPPDKLKLEITESAVMAETDAAVSLLTHMRDKGVGICLDDFGTGYASFSYLHKLPYDTLKIDRSFVSRLGKDEQAQRITEAIVILARNLHMQVVAEGVETELQRQQLQAMGCEYGQGYLFASPLTPDDAERLIDAQQARAATTP